MHVQPLFTSIINYVDILKRSDIADEKILGYLDILEVKAQRLKTLTEDVVEASKVSSGNITLEYMDIDFREMVQQTEGEMAEKLKVLILNGSPRTEGNTTIAIHEMEHVFEENGVEYETIQVGKMDISFDTDFAGYPTIAEALGKPLEIGTIPLSQLTARIELAEFNVSGFQGASVKEKVTVTGVDLLNLNPESYTINEQTHKNATYLSESKTCNVEVYNGVSDLPSTYSFVDNKNLLSFYSFRNLAKAESDQVKMQVRFKIGNSNEERTTRPFVINKEGNILHGVKSGYVYRLVVNMTIIGDKVETELLCYTRDWLNNTISIPMEDNCKRVK